MRNKKEKSKKRDSSSSSSDSSTSASSSSTKSRSKSPAKKERSSAEKQSKEKHFTKRPRTPDKDCKSKWDSPDERVEKRSRQSDRSEKNQTTRHSRDRSNDSRSRRTDQRENKSEKHASRNSASHQASRNPHPRASSKEHDRNQGENSRDRSRHRREGREYGASDKSNQRERENRHQRNRSRSPNTNRRHDGRRRRTRSRSFDHSKAVWGKADQGKKPPEAPKEKEKPNFALSGKLTEETNTYKGVVIKYSEPPEARKPKRRWRLYPFKGEKAMQTLYIHRESAYLIGRDRKLVDLPVDHPSCSKQHAALQYRLVPFTRTNGSVGKRVRPYLIDLDSANGTYINNKKVDARKYIELLERDVIKFGFSSREYVVLHENSKDEAQDDDVSDEVVVAAAPPEVKPDVAEEAQAETI